jgi:hypothetical protein
MVAANARSGWDRAGSLAEHVGLPGGVSVAMLLGAGLSGWLAWRGPGAIARCYGIGLGLLSTWGLYSLVRPHGWVLGVLLVGAFGPQAEVYTGLAGFLLLAGVFRALVPLGEAAVGAVLRRRAAQSTGTDRAGPPPDALPSDLRAASG